MKQARKTLTNSMTLSFLSLSQNESFARQAVCAFVAQLDPTLEELSDTRIIISEAVTNCVVHAYKKTPGEVFLSVKCYSDKSIAIKIKDKGCGIENVEQAMVPFYTTDKQGERSGMGFAIMQGLSKKLKVKSETGKGTTLDIYIKFGE
ncbi:MAG: anti-sigma F factor [Ruminococcaceae bacterium]|nr:anti-sigma F factor [Oscillospiraceae bacterium]